MIRTVRILLDKKLQPPTALIPPICGWKASGSMAVGKANVFIFPDFNAGKQGFSVPVSNLSRRCNIADVVTTSVVTLVQTQGAK